MNNEAKMFEVVANLWPDDVKDLEAGKALSVSDAKSSVDEAVSRWASDIGDVQDMPPHGLRVFELARVQRPADFAPKDFIKELVDNCLLVWAEEYGEPGIEPECSQHAYNEARAAIGDACAKLAETLPITRYTKVGERTLSRAEVVEILKREGVVK